MMPEYNSKTRSYPRKHWIFAILSKHGVERIKRKER